MNTVHSFDNIENIKRAVEIGSGVSILPEPTVQREVDAGTLVSLHLKDVAWHRPIGVIHRRHKTLSTAASKFKELLKAPADSLPPVDRANGNKNGRARVARPMMT